MGVGLIGGSLAAASKRFWPEIEVWGVDSPETLEKALQKGYIDTAAPDIAALPDDLDLLFLGAPIHTNIELLNECVASRVWRDLLATDLGSTKNSILSAAENAGGEGWSFIGGHPMAGGERGGVDNANPFLFQNAVYVLCPCVKRPPGDEKLAFLINLLYRIGARVIQVSASLHDRLVAHISHLPYLTAVSLLNFIAGEEKSDLFYQLAAGGYRDLTRIAQSTHSVWNNIIRDNKQNIIQAVDALILYMQHLKQLLEKEQFQPELLQARKIRERLPANTKGFINPLVDIRIEIEDKAGVLQDITSLLANDGINIKDIAILKIRENLGGVLQLSFEDRQTADRSQQLLEMRGYKIFN